MDIKKLEKAIENLSDVCKESYNDFFEDIGILTDDVAEMLSSSNSKEFINQKSDARRVLKNMLKTLNNITYSEIVIAKRNKEK